MAPAPVMVAPAGRAPAVRRPAAWVRRYGPAEALALVGALATFVAIDAATGDRTAASFAAALGDNLGYYGSLLVREVRRRAALSRGPRRRLRVVADSLRALACEFGPAELLDCTIVRPAFTALATAAAGTTAGVLIAKVAADVAFYVPVIGIQELRARGARTRDAHC
jgi:hypothetical protein